MGITLKAYIEKWAKEHLDTGQMYKFGDREKFISDLLKNVPELKGKLSEDQKEACFEVYLKVFKERNNMSIESFRKRVNEIVNRSDNEYDCESPNQLRSKEFYEAVTDEMNKLFPKERGYTIITNGPPYSMSTGFIKKNGNYVYYSFEDYRFRDWDKYILVRTARNDSDYTGGPNNFADLNGLKEKVEFLFKQMERRREEGKEI